MLNAKNIKFKPLNTIHGVSVIDQRARFRFGCTNDEMVMAHALHKMTVTHKEQTVGRIYRWTGFDHEKNEVVPLLQSLIKKNIIKKVGVGTYEVTEWYQKVHDIVIDDAFEIFWNKSGRCQWTGSKSDAKKLFTKLSITYGSDYLIERKTAYFKYLNHENMKFRRVMGASVFLNPETKRFEENWEGYLEDEEKGTAKYEQSNEKEKYTTEDKKKQFS